MERYEMIKLLGEGIGGKVWKAVNRRTEEIVAIKKMNDKFYSWEECMNLREFKALRKLNHPNIIRLEEVTRQTDELYLVFEYMEHDLDKTMKERQEPFSELEVRKLCFQVLCALDHMHRFGYFHRDLKPANLLVTKEDIKIADFGLAREVRSCVPYEDYVVTRWYRAPEVLLKKKTYDAAIDMWAMGAIMAELFTLKPLFQGRNEIDQVYKICTVIGTPDGSNWLDGIKLAASMNFKFPQIPSTDLSMLIPTGSADAINLITALCSWDPSKRPTASQALAHPFFQVGISVLPSIFNMADVEAVLKKFTMYGQNDAESTFLDSTWGGNFSFSTKDSLSPSSDYSVEHKRFACDIIVSNSKLAMIELNCSKGFDKRELLKEIMVAMPDSAPHFAMSTFALYMPGQSEHKNVNGNVNCIHTVPA